MMLDTLAFLAMKIQHTDNPAFVFRDDYQIAGIIPVRLKPGRLQLFGHTKIIQR